MNNLKKIEQTLDSREVAEMVGKEHHKLLRDIRIYTEQLTESKIGCSDFFRESNYKDSTGRTLPSYQVTKKGCEFIAHKLTGVKGTAFTARYINRFHEMQEQIAQESEKKELVALRKQIEKQNRLLTKAMSSGITTAGSLDTIEGRYKREINKRMESIHDKISLSKIYTVTKCINEHQQSEAL